MTTGKKLTFAALVVTGVTGYMAYLGASSSWQYYVTVDDCLTDSARLARDRVRVNGRIAAGSLQIADDRRQARFALEGTTGKLTVICSGSLPDNLAERMDVVVEGRLDDSGILRSDKVLTRCASKYKSQATAESAPHKVFPGREDSA